MQRNAAKIQKEMNYDDAEAHLISNFIISITERSKLANEKYQDKIWYVIEKVSKGTRETFYSFLKALKNSENDANHQLMIHLQGQSTPLCQSEMLNTLGNSTQNELVFGSPTNCIIPSSYSSTSTLSNRPLSNASPQNVQSPPSLLPIDGTASDEEKDWVIVLAQTDTTYNKNLALLMEHICNKITEFLTGTTYAQQVYEGITVPIKLAKEVYLQADPQTAATCAVTADEQIRCSYKLLMKILQKISNSGINIDLHPILQELGYAKDEAVSTDCSIEDLIIAVERLNQTKKHCIIL